MVSPNPLERKIGIFNDQLALNWLRDKAKPFVVKWWWDFGITSFAILLGFIGWHDYLLIFALGPLYLAFGFTGIFVLGTMLPDLRKKWL